MIKKRIEKIVVYVVFGALLISFGLSIWALIEAQDLYQLLLAVSVAVAIFGGVINMWNIFSSSKQFDELLSKKDREIAQRDRQIAQKDEELAILKDRRNEEIAKESRRKKIHE